MQLLALLRAITMAAASVFLWIALDEAEDLKRVHLLVITSMLFIVFNALLEILGGYYAKRRPNKDDQDS